MRCSQCHRRPPSGHGQDSPAGWRWLRKHPQLHPHGVQEGERVRLLQRHVLPPRQHCRLQLRGVWGLQ
ncbi:SLC25A48 isoform 7 [Pongo abelii]|uniref:SLC25A48 isoform 7 n=1 Tax=Pongo abelii TaxID=9601 RepID=A0A2J8VQ60_PONAB|nr:SLC25A48 isoform 7 [Pongo abelii]